jgi:hypothetical protein
MNLGRHSGLGLHPVQEAQLHHDRQQKKAVQKAGTQKVLQMVWHFGLAQRGEVV